MNDHVEKWQNNVTKQMIFILNEKIDCMFGIIGVYDLLLMAMIL